MSESCYVFETDQTKEAVFEDLKTFIRDDADKLTVATFDKSAIIYSDSIVDLFEFFTKLGKVIETKNSLES